MPDTATAPAPAVTLPGSRRAAYQPQSRSSGLWAPLLRRSCPHNVVAAPVSVRARWTRWWPNRPRASLRRGPRTDRGQPRGVGRTAALRRRRRWPMTARGPPRPGAQLGTHLDDSLGRLSWMISWTRSEKPGTSDMALMRSFNARCRSFLFCQDDFDLRDGGCIELASDRTQVLVQLVDARRADERGRHASPAQHPRDR